MRSINFKVRLLIGLAIVVFAFVKRCNSKEKNEFTGRIQSINMSSEQEIAIGLDNKDIMPQQHGGLHPSNVYQSLVDEVGIKLVNNSIAKIALQILISFIC